MWEKIAIGVILGVAVYTDLTYRKIFNWLTLPTAVAGVCVSVPKGIGEVGNHLFGMGVGVFVLLPFFLLGMGRGLGGGDVKLMGVVGAWVGFPNILSALFYTALWGGVVSLGTALYKGRLQESLKRTLEMIRAFYIPGMKVEGALPSDPLHVPYGVAILLGTLCAFWVPVL